MKIREEHSTLWEIANSQYLSNPIANAIVRALADSVDKKIDRKFIMAAIGNWPMLDILIAGQMKLAARIDAEAHATRLIVVDGVVHTLKGYQ